MDIVPFILVIELKKLLTDEGKLSIAAFKTGNYKLCILNRRYICHSDYIYIDKNIYEYGSKK